MSSEPLIACRELLCGRNVQFGERVRICGIDGPAERVELGDNVTIGDDVRIIAPRVHLGDFSVVHNHCTFYGYSSLNIGACSWIGQNVLLNCTAPLVIGRGATLSAYCSIWTHFSGGDPLEGCRFDNTRPANLGEDVWIGVQCTLAPVSVGDKALLLAGSVLTKAMPANSVWGGNPAGDLTAKLGRPYAAPSLEEKFARLCARLRAFHAALEPDLTAQAPGSLTLGGITVAMQDVPAGQASVFDVRDRSYSKLGTDEEIAFMRFLLPRIKFYPRASRTG